MMKWLMNPLTVKTVQNNLSLESLGNIELIPIIIGITLFVVFLLSRIKIVIKVLVTLVGIVFLLVILGIIPF